MVKVHRPKFSGKKQLNCKLSTKVRPVDKGLTHGAMDFAASNECFGQWVGTEDASKFRQKR